MKLLQVLAMSFALVLVGVGGASMMSTGAAAKDTLLAQNANMKKKQTLRSISPTKGKLVSPSLGLSAGGGAGLTCCTHWNTSTGGTGCATFPDNGRSCPSGQFEVDCGSDGCW